MRVVLASLFASRTHKRHTVRTVAHRRPLLEKLEDRNLLSITFSIPATMSGDVTLTGTPGTDRFIIRLGTGGQTIQFSDNNGAAFTTANLADLTSATVAGLGGSDRLTLDMSNGVIGHASVALPISYNGGSGRPTLILEGTPPTSGGAVTEVFTAGPNARAGTLTINAAGVAGGAAPISSSITFTNLGLIQDIMTASSLTINGPAHNSAFRIRNGPNVNGFKTDAVQGLNTGLTGDRDDDSDDSDEARIGDDSVTKGNGFVTIEFANKTTVTINGQGGDDLVILNAPKAAVGLQTLNLNGGGGNNILANLHVGGGVSVNVTNFTTQMNDEDDVFIETQFLQDLGRTARLDEIPFWKGVLNNGGLGAGRLNVINGILQSDEGLDMFVRNLYRQYLRRDTVNDEERFWVNLLKSGETQEQILAGILGSQEFFDRAQKLVASGTPNERFIQAVYLVLFDRTPSQSEVNYWLNLLQTDTRTEAALAFLESQEFRTDVVNALFNELLERPPEPEGLAFWLNAKFTMRDMREGIMASAEFLANFES